MGTYNNMEIHIPDKEEALLEFYLFLKSIFNLIKNKLV